jgi:hypothetical protein
MTLRFLRTRGAAPVGAINSGIRIKTRKATPLSERRSDAESRPPDEGRTAMRAVCIMIDRTNAQSEQHWQRCGSDCREEKNTLEYCMKEFPVGAQVGDLSPIVPAPHRARSTPSFERERPNPPHSTMANQYDLTPTLSQYLDRHMVSQLLDFAQERKVRLRWMSAIRVCLQVAAPILHCGGPQQLTLYYLASLFVRAVVL